MTGTHEFAAEIIRRSASGYAGLAASLLTEKAASLNSQAGAREAWKDHLTQRLIELSSALGAGESRLFSERVVWSRKTFAARKQDEQLLGLSLQCLKEVLNDSLPANAATPVQSYLDAALSELQKPAPGPDVSGLDPDNECGRLALTYLQDILDGNGALASRRIVQAVEQGLSAEHAYLDVLLAAQKEIGRLWHAGDVSVAEEHLVSMTTQKTMAIIAYVAPRAAENGATVVTACVAGNAHDIGMRALSDLYYLSGWRSIFLGADVPVRDLPDALDVYSAAVVSLTATLTTQADQAAAAVKHIRAHCQRPVKVLVGGALFDEAPELAREIGADAYAPDLREAIRLSASFLVSG